MRSQLRPSTLLRVLATLGLVGVTAPPAVAQDTAFVRKTFTYKVVGETKIEADVYRADDQVTRPVVVWIHGGALMAFTRLNPPPRLLALCRVAGFVLVSIDYRLAPKVTLPAIIDDLEDAFAWIREEGPMLFHADPDKLVVTGGSAGGYLTMTSGFRIQPRPTALVSLWGYGALDTFGAEPSEYYRTSAPLVTEEEAYRPGSRLSYLYLRQNGLWTKVVTGFDPHTQGHELDPYAPIRNVTPEYPPIIMIHGTNDNDVPHEESVAMAEELTKHDVAHELILVPEGGHGLGGADQGLITDAHNRALAFIHQHLLGEARATEIEPLLAALAALDEGLNLVRQGKINEARDAYAKARALESMSVTARHWNTLCWYGALWGHAGDVMTACEQAVALAPYHGGIRDSRGLARALTGDLAGAVADFEAFVAWTPNNEARTQRQGWIEALRHGENPFTPEVLEALRGQ